MNYHLSAYIHWIKSVDLHRGLRERCSLDVDSLSEMSGEQRSNYVVTRLSDCYITGDREAIVREISTIDLRREAQL